MSNDAASNKTGIEFEWGVKIPMRDGIRLNATIYRPQQAERTPVVVTITPYISDSYHERAMYFSQNGYAFALVDCRGRGNSEGLFKPFQRDAEDGYDVIEWLAAQPWCDGQAAMWGGSYAGFNQWAALSRFPPHLRTIVPAAAACPGVDFPMFKNIAYSYEMRWLTFTSGNTGNANLFREEQFWIDKFREWYFAHRPFRELDQVVGNPSEMFQEILDHPMVDEHWDRMSPSAQDFARMDIPILSITGHYDDDQPGALHFYREHLKHASEHARQRHYLLMGPWDHPGTRTPMREFAGLQFGEACLVNLNELHKQWYDWVMKGGDKPDFLKSQVAYYIGGSEEWIYADRLEETANSALRLYVDSVGGEAHDVFHSGTLSTSEPGDSQPDTYIYDPLDTRPAALETEPDKVHLTSQRFALALYGNGLVYHSEPFAEETILAGQPRFDAWISIDVPDTDFLVTLDEILPDGRVIRLGFDLMRARHRESLREERLVAPGEIACYSFGGFNWVARRIARGSRLRLLIRALNSIQFEKNYNSGGVVAEESGKDARVAHVSLHHDAEYPSYLELPIKDLRRL